jgi:hypothetical protein
VSPPFNPTQVFPANGAPTISLANNPGWTNVSGQAGQFVDNWLGAGGSGATPVRCRRGPPLALAARRIPAG